MQVATTNTAVTAIYVCGHDVQFMQNNVTACQKAQCVFHGIPRERDRTTGVHACVGDSRGCPTSSGDKQSGSSVPVLYTAIP